jgi:hypothetical protein
MLCTRLTSSTRNSRAAMPALAFDFLCSVFKKHHSERTQTLWRLEVRSYPLAGRRSTWPQQPDSPVGHRETVLGAASQSTGSSGECQAKPAHHLPTTRALRSRGHLNRCRPSPRSSPPTQPPGPIVGHRPGRSGKDRPSCRKPTLARGLSVAPANLPPPRPDLTGRDDRRAEVCPSRPESAPDAKGTELAAGGASGRQRRPAGPAAPAGRTRHGTVTKRP